MRPKGTNRISASNSSPERLRKWMIGMGLVLVAALPLVHSAIVIPLTPSEQAQVGLAMVTVALLASRSSFLRPMIIFLSAFASMRYFYWRVSWTLNWNSQLEAVVSLVLLSAETYGLLILFLGYFQTIETVARKVSPARNRFTVDVFIPSYNEPLEIVCRTVIGALAMSYPLKNVYVLDDGRRAQIEALANTLGCGYITRPNNEHAKAGNLNHALARTNGELIAIFDADHVPVRSFLDQTVGFFEDASVALVQTPHHFFNPDPFERNLRLTDRIAPEQDFFYRVIQPGNDFWNSAFFCGSCAVLRRSSLEKIGGFKTKSVTEDAFTSMELHARGYRSVYYGKPLAAGLATETLTAYVRQRIRWARGMAQILRTDCPLFKHGLRLPQRLNYFHAMLHFFFGLPRLVLVLAPLAYLVFGLHPLRADALAVLAYIFPHIGISTIANSSLGRQFRHSFWASVYEVTVAPYTTLVTLLALVNPRFGKFNVTEKGATLDRAQFDSRASRFTLALLALTLAGLLVAFPVRLFLLFRGGDPTELDSMVMNSLWAFANLLTLAAAASVAYEQPQQRLAPRVRRSYPCELVAEGQRIAAQTEDLSETGIRVMLASAMPVPPECRLAIWDESGRRFEARGKRVRCDWSSSGRVEAAFAFPDLDQVMYRTLVELIFTGDESWTEKRYPSDSVLRSFWYLLSAPWRATKPRVASRRRAPRLQGSWRARYAVQNCRCLALSAVGAVVEFSAGIGDIAQSGLFIVEIEPGRRVEAEVASIRRRADEPGQFVMEFHWRDFSTMKNFWTAVYECSGAQRHKTLRKAVRVRAGTAA